MAGYRLRRGAWLCRVCSTLPVRPDRHRGVCSMCLSARKTWTPRDFARAALGPRWVPAP